MALCCGGGGGDDCAEDLDAEEKARNDRLQQRQAQEDAKEKNIIKMLLLGAGESGKSTIFKQMKVINKGGYNEKDRKEFTGIVHSNVVVSVKAILGAFQKLAMQCPEDLVALGDEFDSLTEKEKLDPRIGSIAEKIWAHPQTKEIYKRRSEYQLNDSCQYYMDDIIRVSADGYIPTEQDVLRSRVRTTGIVQSDFSHNKINLCMFDVGGQRNERRKWIHCFDNVQAVVFVASLSEFDQKLYEDESQNRLDEAVQLFDQICNSKWFKNTSIILFLNKKDLFQEKLAEKNFADYLEDYMGPNEWEPCAAHVQGMFVSKNRNAEKSIFTHSTCATDTGNIKFVFNAVVAIILEQNMKSSGLA